MSDCHERLLRRVKNLHNLISETRQFYDRLDDLKCNKGCDGEVSDVLSRIEYIVAVMIEIERGNLNDS